jgi:hypothetical protein
MTSASDLRDRRTVLKKKGASNLGRIAWRLALLVSLGSRGDRECTPPVGTTF